MGLLDRKHVQLMRYRKAHGSSQSKPLSPLFFCQKRGSDAISVYVDLQREGGFLGVLDVLNIGIVDQYVRKVLICSYVVLI